MDSRSPPPGSPQQPSSRLGFPSASRWWPQRWVPAFLSARKDGTIASFDVDDGSTPGSPALPHHFLDGVDPSSPVASSYPVQQERLEAGEGRRFASITPTTATGAPTNFTSVPPPPTAAAASEAKSMRVPSSLLSIQGVSVAAESSASTTPCMSLSAASTPRALTPMMAPLSEGVHAAKPRTMMVSGGGGKQPSSITASSRGASAFLLPAAASVSGAMTEEQRRTSPACVELPGPQSLFIRSGAGSGCDSRSIGLLQKSVLAEHYAAPFSR